MIGTVLFSATLPLVAQPPAEQPAAPAFSAQPAPAPETAVPPYTESKKAAATPDEKKDAAVETVPVEPLPSGSADPAADIRFLEAIVVTAQKRKENIQDVPIAISAFSGDTLTTLGITDTRDLQRLVPGFSANESGRNTTLFTLRGVGLSDTTYTATNTVGVYIDEVNLPYSVRPRRSGTLATRWR